MAFPTIPLVAAGRILFTLNTAGGATKTFPNLSSLTKNAGDRLIAIIVEYDGNSTDAEFSNWGGGFTERADRAGTTTMAIGVAEKISDGTESGTFTVTTADTSTNDSVLILMSIPGAHASLPIEVGAMTTGTTAAADLAALSPSWGAADTLWIAVVAAGETSTTGSFTGVGATLPGGFGNGADSGITADVVGGVEAQVSFAQENTATQDPAGGSPDTTNARNAALLIAVPPPAGEPEFVAELATESDLAADLTAVAEPLLNAELAESSDTAADAVLRAEVSFVTDQATEADASQDGLFSSEQALSGELAAESDAAADVELAPTASSGLSAELAAESDLAGELGLSAEQALNAEPAAESDTAADVTLRPESSLAGELAAETAAAADQVFAAEPVFTFELATEGDAAVDVVLGAIIGFDVGLAIESDVAADIVFVTEPVFTWELATSSELASDLILVREPVLLAELAAESDVAADVGFELDPLFVFELTIESDAGREVILTVAAAPPWWIRDQVQLTRTGVSYTRTPVSFDRLTP